MAPNEIDMETLIIIALSLFVSWSYIKFAPMHDLKTAMQYAKIREQNGTD